MLPGKLTLIDYLTFEKAEIDFKKIRKALILGIRNNDITSSNGSGKSNLLRSIPWCLWGINPDAEDIDQNVRWGTDFCSVQFDFSHHNEEISVIRTRNSKTNKSTLDLFINGIHSNGNSIAETTQKITTKINLDYNAYINSCYIRQNDIHSLANSEDKNKSRELFERLMGLDVYDDYFDATDEIVKALELERDTLFGYIKSNVNISSLIEGQNKLIEETLVSIENKKNNVKTYRVQIDERTVKYDYLKLTIGSKESVIKEHASSRLLLNKIILDVDDLISKANSFKADLSHKKNQYRDTIAGENSIIEDSKKWEKTVAEGLESQDKANLIENEIAAKRIEVVRLQNSVNSIETKVGIYQHDVKNIKTEIEEINNKINNPNIAIGSKCDSCLTDITDNTLDHYISHLNNDILIKNTHMNLLKNSGLALKPQHAEDKGKIDEINKDILTLTSEKESLIKTIISPTTDANTRALYAKSFETIKTAKAELLKLDLSQDSEQWDISIKNKNIEIDAQTKLVKELSLRLDNTYEQDEAEIKKIKEEIEDMQESIISLEGEIVLLNSNINISKSKIIDFDIINRKVLENQVTLLKVEDDIVTYGELLEAFSPKGIRYHILRKAIRELEIESNKILPVLSHGNLRIRFQTKKEIQKSKKGNQEKLVFDAFINDGEKELPFAGYSGGEQFRISFVIRVALSNLLLKRANADLQFLVIDEAISPLDQAGIEMIIPTINELQSYFKIILVITHRSEVKQYFDEIITVKRNKYVSRIEA